MDYQFYYYVEIILENIVIAFRSLWLSVNLITLSLSKFQIKKLDPASKRVSTLAGTGKAGFKEGTALEAQVGQCVWFLLFEGFWIEMMQEV